MLFNDTYRKYLEHQAINHPDLLHTPGSRVFQMIDVEEALGDFRTIGQEKGFIMRGIFYTYNIAQNADTLKFCNGGFIIAHYHSNRLKGQNDFFEAMRKSEKVVDEIIEKMIADSINDHPLFYQSLNTPQSFSVSPKVYTGDTGYSGYICTFHFNNHWRNCIDSPHAPEWGDDGLTPHNLIK